MAVLTKGTYNCACSREVCDWSCTTYATMLSDSVPNTAAKPFNNLEKTDEADSWEAWMLEQEKPKANPAKEGENCILM